MNYLVKTGKNPYISALFILVTMFFFVGTLIPSVSALTLKEGNVRLELHEKTGRFSLYYLSDAQSERYTPLFFARDPRTSSIGLLVENSIVIPGSSSGFEQSLERTSGGARFIWTSSELRISEEFSFISSGGSGPADGIKIAVTVQNRKRSSLLAGIYVLVDTYLAEDNSTHFVTSDGEDITGETEFSSSGSMPQYWISPADFDNFSGLQFMLKGRGITTPDRVIFANWKRLSDNLWNMESRSGRSFNLPPYSINDSAAALFFEPARLTPNSSRSVTIALGAAGEGSFAASYTGAEAASEEETEEPSQEADTEAEPGKAEEREEEDSLLKKIRKNVSEAAQEKDDPVEEDLEVVNDILSNIDSLLSSPEKISNDKLELLEEALSSLEDRTKNSNSSSE